MIGAAIERRALGIRSRLALGIVPRKAKTAAPITSTPTIGLYVVIVWADAAGLIDTVEEGPPQRFQLYGWVNPPNAVKVKVNPHHERKILTSESAPASKATKLIFGNVAEDFAAIIGHDVGLSI